MNNSDVLMGDCIDELTLAERVGCTHEWLREKRGLRGVDFHRLAGGRIVWTNAAAGILARSLGIPLDQKITRVVFTVAVASPGRLSCVPDGVPQAARSAWRIVRVPGGTWSLFLPGMRVRAEQEACLSWRYLGPENASDGAPIRYPKTRGKW